MKRITLIARALFLGACILAGLIGEREPGPNSPGARPTSYSPKTPAASPARTSGAGMVNGH